MKKYQAIVLTVLTMMSMASCRTADTLTEDEILAFDKQGWLYSILLLDPYLDAGVPDITVEVTIGGELLTLTSNATGSIEFTSGFNPQFEVSVTGQGYFSISRKLSSLVEETPNRGKTISNTFVLFPDADYATFTLQGKATVQSDLTTAEREVASGANFSFELSIGSDAIIFPIVTDGDGRYKAKLPAFPNASSYRVFYEAYTINQTLAVNALIGQPSFPATLPSIMQIETSFDPTNSSINPIPFVQQVYATAPAPPAGSSALQANPFRITSFDGIGGLNLSTVGITPIGGGYLAGDHNLTIVSIGGGSGATGVVRDTGVDGILDQYQITGAGSGYPLNNASVNKVGGQFFSADFANNTFLGTTTSTFRPGAIIINDIYYGTGSSRSIAVN